MPINPSIFRSKLGSKYILRKPPAGFLSTQVPNLDHIIGRGGIPLSKLTIITGVEAAGKTTLALHLVKQVQDLGGIAAYIDAEYKLDEMYARSLGVNWDDVIHVQPEHMEHSFQMIELCADTAASFSELSPECPGIVLVDSINALVPKKQLEGEYGDAQPGVQAAAMSKSLPKLLKSIAMRPIALVFISQVRTKIGGYGSSRENVGCGWAPKFYNSLTIELRRVGIIKRSQNNVEREIGLTTEAKTVKNQVSAPFKRCQFDILWGKGVDRHKAMYDLGVELGIVKCASGWYSMEMGKNTRRWGTNQREYHGTAMGTKVVAELCKRIERVLSE